MKVTKAVIPAAGLGTRFLPATKAQPKEMLPIVDKPTIQYIVEEAAASGIKDILIITGRTKRAVEDHFDKAYELENELKRSGKEDLVAECEAISDMVNMHYVRQKEARGLGHAILCAKAFVGKEPFAVLLGDDVVYNTPDEVPCIKQLINIYEDLGGSVIGGQTVRPEDVSKYGIIDGEPCGERMQLMKGMVEKPKMGEEPSRMAALGRYVLSADIFEILGNTKPGKAGEIQLTDAICELAKRNKVYSYDFIGRRYDVGSRQGFLEATIEYALRRDDLKGEFLAYLKGIV